MKLNLSPYIHLMRLDKPVGTLLALWPTLWALWLANAGIPNLKLLGIFICGTLVMRSAGCVINDILDRKIDKQVARTQMRPLAQGLIPVSHALGLLFILLGLAFLLVLQLNLFSIFLAFIVVLFSLLYPLCKRYIQAPQLFLGITFNAGVLLAFSASINQLPAIAWFLFFICILWTIAYDTLYAMIDKPDDLKIGVKSTAILFGRYDFIITCGLYALFFVGLILLGLHLAFNPIYYAFICLASLWMSYYLYKAAHTLLACFQAFCANNGVGFLIFIGIFFALNQQTFFHF